MAYYIVRMARQSCTQTEEDFGSSTENFFQSKLAELLTLRKDVNPAGTIRYYNKDNQLHRIHGPAVIYTDGTVFYFENGILIAHKKETQ